MSSSDGQSGRKSIKGKATTGVVIAILVGIYSFAQPIINKKYGLNLPSIRGDKTATVTSAPESSGPLASQSTESRSSANDSADNTKSDLAANDRSKTSSTRQNTAAAGSTSANFRGPLAERMKPSSTDRTQSTRGSPASAEPKTDSQTAGDETLVYGLLRETSPKRYLSPSGLQYVPGSAEGHRLEHLRRHTEDQPGRPGKHGVFDGGMEGAIKTIDRAYDKAKKNQRTTKSVDDGRTIYTVDMGSRVGFIGGREGNQRRKPMARRVKMVLEGTRVITAYPL